MADDVKTTQVNGQVEYAEPGQLKITQAIGQIELTRSPTGAYAYELLGQVEYVDIPPVTVNRQFPVPPASRKTESQAGVRKFPAVQ